VGIGRLPEPTGITGREPISKTYTEFLHTLYAPDACSQLRAKQPSVGGLVGKPAHCREPSVYRARRQLTILEGNPVPRDDYSVE
jgi:hypothetical protein